MPGRGVSDGKRPLIRAQRVPDAADRRARVVRLTPRGRALLRAALPIIADIEAAWLQRLAPAGRDLRSALERAIDATTSAPEPSHVRASR